MTYDAEFLRLRLAEIESWLAAIDANVHPEIYANLIKRRDDLKACIDQRYGEHLEPLSPGPLSDWFKFLPASPRTLFPLLFNAERSGAISQNVEPTELRERPCPAVIEERRKALAAKLRHEAIDREIERHLKGEATDDE